MKDLSDCSRLERLKLDLQTIPASSTDSERVFSSAGRFCTKIRNRLSARSLDNFSFGQSLFRKMDSDAGLVLIKSNQKIEFVNAKNN